LASESGNATVDTLSVATDTALSRLSWPMGTPSILKDSSTLSVDKA